MTWYASFQCLSCRHQWLETAPADAWDMVRQVANRAVCPLCGARMAHGQIELLRHSESKAPCLGHAPHLFKEIY